MTLIRIEIIQRQIKLILEPNQVRTTHPLSKKSILILGCLHKLFNREMFKKTNLENKSLISADRNNKATLLLTILRSIKVVCNGFILSNI